MGGTVSTYVLTFYMPTYALHTLGMPMSLSMLVGVASGCVVMVMCPLFGALSDRSAAESCRFWSAAACWCCCCFLLSY
jgi:hypothetical protein